MADPFSIKRWMMKSQRQRISPFPNYMSMEAMTDYLHRYVGVNLKEVMLIFQNNIFYFFLLKDDQKRKGRWLVNKIRQNHSLYESLVRQQKKFGLALVNFSKKSNRKINSQTTDRQLYEIFEEYERKYKLVYATYGSVWIVEDYFMNDLLKIIEKRKPKQPKAISEIVENLTKQPLAMVAVQERKAFLELAVKISQNKNWSIITQNKDFNKIKNNHALFKLIQRHVKNYFWVTRDYEDPVLTFEQVVERLSESLKKNPPREYSAVINGLKQAEAKRKRNIKELKLTKVEISLFAAMRDIAYLKELRKKHISQSLYYFDKVLTEIGRRIFLSIKQVRMMRTIDIKHALLDKVDLNKELNERMKLSVWYSVSRKGTKVITGKKAGQIFKKHFLFDDKATTFSGLAASPGIARGRIRIVMNPKECDKVKKGDIILSMQVVPSFSTAIIKSAGLVCDGGHGITSHPATLAREAGIPAVIQTRHALKVLKEGDLVEVDGYNGMVRKIT